MLNANTVNRKNQINFFSQRLIAFCQLHPEAGRVKKQSKKSSKTCRGEASSEALSCQNNKKEVLN